MSGRQSLTSNVTLALHLDPQRLSDLMGRPIATPEPEPEPEPEQEPGSQAELQPQSDLESQPKPEPQPEPVPQPEWEADVEPQSDLESQPKPEQPLKSEPQPEPVPQPEREPHMEPESEVDTPRMPSVTFPPIPSGGWPFKPFANKPNSNYCCVAKEYYSEYAYLVDSLIITPRLMIHRRPLRKGSVYGLTLTIRNSGLYPRLINVRTDSPSDTTVTIDKYDANRYLDTDKVLTVKISICSKTAYKINRTRHILIDSFHPNITFQVPIIVLKKDLKEPEVCDYLKLPSTVPYDTSYFEMLIYNSCNHPVRVRYRSSFIGLKLNYLGLGTIQKHDYIKVLVCFTATKLQVYKGFFNVKFGLNPPKLVVFDFMPKSMSAYVNRGFISFGHAKFTDSFKRTFNICNESSHSLKVLVDYYSTNAETTLNNTPSVVDTERSSRMFDEAVSMHSVLIYDFNEEKQGNRGSSLNEDAKIHFVVDAPEDIANNASTEVSVTFHPAFDYESSPAPESQDPPYMQRTKVIFCFTDSYECFESHYVLVEGEIDGIEVEVFPQTIDLRRIYLGEEHCAFIKVLNVDAVNAKVKFKDSLDAENCAVQITPIEGLMLSPCERSMFHLSFYTVQPKTFSVTLRFKVENGGIYNVDVNGMGIPVQLRTFPQFVEFGSIPFAIPQKRFMLLMNPLAVPITLQVQTTEDGEEQPLVFNIREQSKILPITIKDPIKELQFAKEDMMADPEPECKIEFSTREPDEKSIQSISVNESVYSLDFEENVLEPIPAIAAHLLQTLKKQKIFDKTETDKRVIHEALASLLNINYFNIFNKHNNFIFMDWHAIPSDPKEVYCDNEIIYLRPNTGRSVTILLIPNKLGYYRRSLTVRICPALPQNCTETSDDQQFKSLIRSELMCSKLWFEYNCCAPEVEWNNYVDLTDRTIYAGEEYSFQMAFTNTSSVAGFLHFDVIPNEMSFFDGIWKHYIGSKATVTAECLVTFRVLGKNKLSGLVKIVGDSNPYPFHLFGRVLATEIRITPLFVHKRIQVFEEDRVHFYIDNFTPTNTKLIMNLKDDRFQYLTTQGGMLAPTGQSMYTTLVSLYTDPDLYYNTMTIDLQFDHVMQIPITYLVEGVPLWFSPDIKMNGFDARFLFTDLKEEFQANLFKNRFVVKVFNKGTRVYRITINRLKTYNPDLKPTACANQPLTARFEMHPKQLEIPPKSETELEILISGYEEGTFFCDFMMTITDTTYPQRKQVIKVTVKATFVDCQLCWHVNPIIFNYKPCEPLKERTYFRTAHLINCNNMRIEHVYLEAAGPFRIKAMYEHSFEKHLVLSLDKLEWREIYILLNKSMVKHLCCKDIEGRIAVFAEGKMHKHLTIKVTVWRPDVQFNMTVPDLVLFDRGHPYDYSIELLNEGCATGIYKWKRIDVSETFIGPDDSEDMVAEVLSEILRMLEYNCDEEPNMTLRYQKCRCQYRRETEVGSLVLDIIDEVINELDLSQRRFLIRMDNVDPCHDKSEVYSSSSFVRYTIDYILDQLNIESSQQLSGASSEYCFSDRFIYFYNKTGILNAVNMNRCELHLPHVRPFHEMKSVFNLEVVGQRSRTLTVTLVNLLHKIKFQKDNIYLNIRPWYETYKAAFNITNLTKYPLELYILPILGDKKKLVAGYARLMHDNFMVMDPYAIGQIKVSGILGLTDNFVRIFAMVINDSANCYFRLRGQGILPILSVTTPLPKLEQSLNDIIEEYEFLRIIYNYETFKSITECDKDDCGNLEEDGLDQESLETPDFTVLSESDEDMPSERQQIHDKQFFLMIHTYVQVFNNQELPNATVLDQMIVTERYLHKLRVQPDLYAIHENVYKAYVDLQQPPSSLRRCNVNHFTVQPLPCEHLAYVLNLGPLLRDTLRRFELRLQFFGPGKLIASARTVVRVPGLYVDFKVDNHADKKFTYWAEKCNAPEFFNSSYRNMWERLADATSPRVQHAHSFDLDSFVRHQRDITDKDRKQISDYYNSLNPSVYPDHKHHFTLARVLTTYHSNFSGVEMRMVGLFKPESKYYEKDQRVEDYIYIDLHMGPTLPILLRAVIK